LSAGTLSGRATTKAICGFSITETRKSGDANKM